MEETIKATYTLGTISTTNLEDYKMAKDFYKTHNFSHYEIYIEGIQSLIVKSQNKVDKNT